MNKHTFSSSGTLSEDSWIYRVLGDQNFAQQRGFFAWWYHLTSPSDAQPDATFQQRDRIRRSRLASALMLFLGTVLLIAGAIGASSPNHAILIVVVSMLCTIVLSIPINRRGWVEVVGCLMVLGLTVGMYTSVGVGAFSIGMSANDKDILYLLFFSELFAGAILPINWVFLVALMNIAFSFIALRFFPHDPAFTLMLHTSFSAIFPRLLQIHIIASGMMSIIVNNLKAALARADRAEEMAKLQHDMAAITSQQAQEKHALERRIDEIVAVHIRVANGDLSARVPFTQDNTLWKLAGPLNTLLGRFQHARQAEEQMQQFSLHMAQAQRLLRQEIRAAIADNRPIRLPKDPLLDPFYEELNGNSITQPQSHHMFP